MVVKSSKAQVSSNVNIGMIDGRPTSLMLCVCLFHASIFTALKTVLKVHFSVAHIYLHFESLTRSRMFLACFKPVLQKQKQTTS